MKFYQQIRFVKCSELAEFRDRHKLSDMTSYLRQKCMNTIEMMSDISQVNCEGLNDKTVIVIGSTPLLQDFFVKNIGIIYTYYFFNLSLTFY